MRSSGSWGQYHWPSAHIAQVSVLGVTQPPASLMPLPLPLPLPDDGMQHVVPVPQGGSISSVPDGHDDAVPANPPPLLLVLTQVPPAALHVPAAPLV
jgi:hypothetical protein